MFYLSHIWPITALYTGVFVQLYREINGDVSTDEYTKQPHQRASPSDVSISQGRNKKYKKHKRGSFKSENSCNVFAEHVANKLRRIQPEQMKFVHKLISDVLFEADMESLNRYFVLVDNSKNIAPLKQRLFQAANTINIRNIKMVISTEY